MTDLHEHLYAFLCKIPDVSKFWVAYSGGLDSHVLLSATTTLRGRLGKPVQVVHVHHGLHQDAGRWAAHCQQLCNQLDIELVTCHVDAIRDPKLGPEATARKARYGAFKPLLKEGDCLLLAHHQDDQAETFLLQALRGAGPTGLSSMPKIVTFGSGRLIRPFLTIPKKELLRYAREHSLDWLEDDSNQNRDMDRNFLRHEIIPTLKKRWPSAAATLSRSAEHSANFAKLIKDIAQSDLDNIIIEGERTLLVSRLNQLTPERQAAVLRVWLAQAGVQLPSTVILKRILNEVLKAGHDREPLVEWPGAWVRRYQDRLFAGVPLTAFDSAIVLSWDNLDEPLHIDTLSSVVRAKPTASQGIAIERCEGKQVSVRFRQGGERCQPAQRGNTHDLKKLFQEWRIPPWRRARVPLIYVDNELAAVAGYTICEPFVTLNNGTGYDFVVENIESD